ncbi:MAG: putative toxin-antitoxin system toxin component, PIN family [Gracilibacteraceae bacterium]|jgi:putative PIN family toxin of toxin-antitoxin system|nr:putative toxin-antitoxin system toxin component, PIN family [Gracilibacteraceae bacterium]
MNVVLDTNIIVSAALSPVGNPAKIIALIPEQEIQVYYCTGILSEYSDVLSRPRLKIPAEIQRRIINAILRAGILLEPTASTIPLPDETDRIFYDTAKEAGAILITGNIKHYPAENFIMTPSQFLNF